jgi:type II secretory pathway pseudopilin PulG
MKLNGMKKIGGAILGLLLFVGVSVMSGTTAQAQYPTWNQDQYRRQQEREQRERARELQRQQQTQQGGWYDQNGNWHSNSTYNNGYYNNGSYNQGYRGRNYDGYGNLGGSYELRQTALNAGYNEGLKAGRSDRSHGRYNPNRSANTLKDYNSRMGDRSTYQQYFMQAYQNGYADGYRGA